jgi:hypothetical protein
LALAVAASERGVLAQDNSGVRSLDGVAVQTGQPIATDFVVGERGLNHRTWNKVITWRDAKGRTVMQINQAYQAVEKVFFARKNMPKPE